MVVPAWTSSPAVSLAMAPLSQVALLLKRGRSRLACLVLGEVAEDDEAVPEGFDGLQDGRHFVIGAGGLGDPFVQNHAVRRVDEGGAELRLRGRRCSAR